MALGPVGNSFLCKPSFSHINIPVIGLPIKIMSLFDNQASLINQSIAQVESHIPFIGTPIAGTATIIVKLFAFTLGLATNILISPAIPFLVIGQLIYNNCCRAAEELNEDGLPDLENVPIENPPAKPFGLANPESLALLNRVLNERRQASGYYSSSEEESDVESSSDSKPENDIASQLMQAREQVTKKLGMTGSVVGSLLSKEEELKLLEQLLANSSSQKPAPQKPENDNDQDSIGFPDNDSQNGDWLTGHQDEDQASIGFPIEEIETDDWLTGKDSPIQVDDDLSDDDLSDDDLSYKESISDTEEAVQMMYDTMAKEKFFFAWKKLHNKQAATEQAATEQAASQMHELAMMKKLFTSWKTAAEENIQNETPRSPSPQPLKAAQLEWPQELAGIRNPDEMTAEEFELLEEHVNKLVGNPQQNENSPSRAQSPKLQSPASFDTQASLVYRSSTSDREEQELGDEENIQNPAWGSQPPRFVEQQLPQLPRELAHISDLGNLTEQDEEILNEYISSILNDTPQRNGASKLEAQPSQTDSRRVYVSEEYFDEALGFGTDSDEEVIQENKSSRVALSTDTSPKKFNEDLFRESDRD